MGFNQPTQDYSNISFGPARVFLGPSGTTPTIDVGALGEDGVSVEWQSEKRDIRQGNPGMIAYSFMTSQGFRVSWTALEYSVANMALAFGAGVTAVSAAIHTWAMGGDPIIATAAVLVQHQMATGGDTLNISVWKARGDGNIGIAMAMEEHKIPMAFQAMRATTNWAGAALGSTSELVSVSWLRT